MSDILPRGLYTQITGRPTVINSGKQAGGALISAQSFASNADNISTGVIQTDVLPLATATTPGIVQPDEVTIHVNATGIINAITATSSSLGIVKPDNTTITINGSGVISAPGAVGGTVTSVGLSLPAELTVSGSPVTTAGTLTATWANETANKVFAGPTTGSPSTPAFRSLVNADMPASGAGSGTVTSVALTMPAIFSVAGSPITSSGTLAVTLANESANTIWSGPTTGAATTPTFRTMVIKDTPILGTNPAVTDVLTTQAQQYASSQLMGF